MKVIIKIVFFILYFCIFIFLKNSSSQNNNLIKTSDTCFIFKENYRTIKIEGECEKRYPPQSTFKIALSLMGFDSNILLDIDYPTWELKKGIDPYINVCRGSHNPKTWMRDSCLWYSEVIANKIGVLKIQTYIKNFNYGNMEVLDYLKPFWVSDSLMISPLEQTDFLEKLINYKLYVSDKAIEKTKELMFIQELPGGWKLYGKTGNGNLIDKNSGKKLELEHGWFVGFIEKGGRKIIFASHIVDNQKHSIYASFRVKNEMINKLWYLINEIE